MTYLNIRNQTQSIFVAVKDLKMTTLCIMSSAQYTEDLQVILLNYMQWSHCHSSQ